MRCAVATSPSRGPRGPSRSAFQVLSEATVADAIRWTRCRKALEAGWCKIRLRSVAGPTPKIWSDPATSRTICLLDMGKF